MRVATKSRYTPFPFPFVETSTRQASNIKHARFKELGPVEGQTNHTSSPSNCVDALCDVLDVVSCEACHRDTAIVREVNVRILPDLEDLVERAEGQWRIESGGLI